MNRRESTLLVLVSLLAIASMVLACGISPVPTPTPTVTPSPTPLPLAEWMEQGDALLQRSEFAGAEIAYKRVIEADEHYAAAHVGLSRLYFWLVGREDDVLAEAQLAVESAPESANAYVALAQAQIVQDDPDAAVAAAENAVELDGESAPAQAMLARAYLLNRQYDAAQEAAEQAVVLDPELADVYYSLSLVYWSTADFSRARAALERAIALEPGFASWHVVLGNLLGALERYDQASAALDTALELAPEYVAAILSLADVSTGRKAYAEAEAQIRQAVELAPDAPDVYVSWGYWYVEQGEYDDALDQLRQALVKDENDWDARVSLGYTYLRQSECDSAASQFQELATEQPRFADGPIGMGFARLCDGDMNKALEYFRKALELEPHSAAAQTGLGHAYTTQERWDDATEAYVEALRLSPGGSRIHNYLGYDFLLQNDIDSAEAEYQTALRLDPNSIEAHLGLGDVFLIKEKYPEAQSHAEQVLAIDDDDEDALRIEGVALYMQGEAEEAAAMLEQLLEKDPENPTAHFFLGLAYRDMGEYSSAQDELETYRALNPQSSDQRLDELIQALDQGYLLTEDKAISDLKDTLEQYLDTTPDVSVEEVEGEGRTLVVTFSAAYGQDQGEIFTNAGIIAGAAARVAPRVDPPIENGLLLQVKQGGQILFDLRFALEDMKHFADGLIASASQVASKLHISRPAAGGATISIAEIEADVAEVRGLEAETEVPYQPMTDADMQAYFTSSMDAETRRATQASDSLLTLLGVIEPDVDLGDLMMDLYVEQVAGFYSTDTKTLYVLESEEQTAMDQMVIAHEYTHALQDQHFGLDEMAGNALDADQRLALDALVEGDAAISMYLYANEHIDLVDMFQAFYRASGLESEALDTTPLFIKEMELFPYEEGLSFAASLYGRGEWEEVDAAYDNPPLSTEQVLHPERYREGDEPQEVTLPNLAQSLSGGWETADSSVLGELGVRLALAQHFGPAAAQLAAEGWGGDRYALLQQGNDGPYVLVIRTVWDDEDEASQFWTLYQVMMAHRIEYTEDVQELTGDVQSHAWVSEGNRVLLNRGEGIVTIVIGPDEEIVNQVLAVLTGQ